MAMSFLNILLTTVSTVVGVLLLAASAIALDNYRQGIDDCLNDDDKAWALVTDKARDTICKPFYGVVAATTIGILIGSLQIFTGVISLARRESGGACWIVLQVISFFCTLAGFGVAVHFLGNGCDSNATNVIYYAYCDNQKNKLLMAALGIDWIFTFLYLVLNALVPKDGFRGYRTL